MQVGMYGMFLPRSQRYVKWLMLCSTSRNTSSFFVGGRHTYVETSSSISEVGGGGGQTGRASFATVLTCYPQDRTRTAGRIFAGSWRQASLGPTALDLGRSPASA